MESSWLFTIFSITSFALLLFWGGFFFIACYNIFRPGTPVVLALVQLCYIPLHDASASVLLNFCCWSFQCLFSKQTLLSFGSPERKLLLLVCHARILLHAKIIASNKSNVFIFIVSSLNQIVFFLISDPVCLAGVGLKNITVYWTYNRISCFTTFGFCVERWRGLSVCML